MLGSTPRPSFPPQWWKEEVTAPQTPLPQVAEPAASAANGQASQRHQATGVFPPLWWKQDNAAPLTPLPKQRTKRSQGHGVWSEEEPEEAGEEPQPQSPPQPAPEEAAAQEETSEEPQLHAPEEPEEIGEEAPMRGRRVPRLPSAETLRLHNRTHLPFRSWCRHCVEGRKSHLPHPAGSSNDRPEDAMPEVHVDYAFFRNEVGGETVPVLVLKDRDSKALAAHVIPYKGGDHDWTVEQSVRDIKKWGLRRDLIIRSDQEEALKRLVTELIKARAADGSAATTNAREFKEDSPVSESQSKGTIEAGVKTVEGMVRTVKFCLEAKLGIKI